MIDTDQKKLVLAFLDKKFPPAHSFVDGIFASSELKGNGISVKLVVSRSQSSFKATRYKRVVCLPFLHPRIGFGRFLNMVKSARLILYYARRCASKESILIVFVRNDPAILLAASILRLSYTKLVFQSSFPHEETGGWIKRVIAKMLIKASSQSIGYGLAVSPKGKQRLQEFLPATTKIGVIPLLADSGFYSTLKKDHAITEDSSELNFLYVGDHSVIRRLDVVLHGVCLFLDEIGAGRFLFVGGKRSEIEILASLGNVRKWIDLDRIIFIEKVERDETKKYFEIADVGFSLIPRIKLFEEASPTKLTEYMSYGLAVIASPGVQLQDEWIIESNCGVIVGFDSFEIAQSIKKIFENPSQLSRMKLNAKTYSRKYLNYSNYLPVFFEAVEVDAPTFNEN